MESINSYKWTNLQNINRLTDLENQLMITQKKLVGGWIKCLGLTYTLIYIK